MKIRIPQPSLLPDEPSLWPQNKAGVIELANNWYDVTRVKINDQAIEKLDFGYVPPGMETSMTSGKLGINWANNVALSIALNSINYQFWDLGENNEFLRYDHEGVQGAQGMRNAFERAWNDSESPISQARQGTPLTLADIQSMFGDIPSPQSRVDILNEVLLGSKLQQFSQQLTENLDQTGKISTELAKELTDAFPLAYGDALLKKSQLALSEVWTKALDAGQKIDCELTAFADYQIPNILRAMGVLEYDNALASKIDAFQPIEPNSADERAIRAASILAVEKIAEVTGSNVAAVDHYLWTRRKEAQTPFHLTFTTAY